MNQRMKGWALALGMACFAGAAVAAEAPAPQPVPQPAIEAPAPSDEIVPVEIEVLGVDAACEETNASMAEPAVEHDLVDSADAVAGCKPCKGRTWCKCTYNGQPRSSCDPCCYTNNIGVTVCLD